jgi:hypothetical protein
MILSLGIALLKAASKLSEDGEKKCLNKFYEIYYLFF